ncbi:exported protein, unknown function, partial [Hepatocystis sp. ex Piliocolobus tephrosceles]
MFIAIYKIIIFSFFTWIWTSNNRALLRNISNTHY